MNYKCSSETMLIRIIMYVICVLSPEPFILWGSQKYFHLI